MKLLLRWDQRYQFIFRLFLRVAESSTTSRRSCSLIRLFSSSFGNLDRSTATSFALASRFEFFSFDLSSSSSDWIFQIRLVNSGFIFFQISSSIFFGSVPDPTSRSGSYLRSYKCLLFSFQRFLSSSRIFHKFSIRIRIRSSYYVVWFSVAAKVMRLAKLSSKSVV
jgi:hypothetical protein